MNGLKYQLKNIRRDKMCILTFLLPIIVGLAINMMSGMSFSSVSEIAFGVLESDLPADTAGWLEASGNVTVYEKIEDLKNAINDPATQMIGVLYRNGGVKTMLSGDELKMTTTIGNTLPQIYAERGELFQYTTIIVPPEQDNDVLKPLLIVITMATAMFMGCTFNAMSIISEKEDGIVFINEVLPMTRTQYIFQKIVLGFVGGTLSTAITAVICMRIEAAQILPMILLIVLSAFVAALTGIFIGHFSSSLMVGIVYIKMTMILFLAPPILFYLLTPAGSIARSISYILPSSATFYGLLDLLSGKTQNIYVCLAVLLTHCIVWFMLYITLSMGRKKCA